MDNSTKPPSKSLENRGFETYQRAMISCKCGCIKHKGKYLITNSVWEKNQLLLLETRQNYTNEEKDKILRQALYNKLKECEFKDESSHIKLTFNINFVMDEAEKTKNFVLCESCYAEFQDHRCERTWANWKKEIKKNIIVSGFAAEASAAFTKKMRESGHKDRFENIEEARKALTELGFNDEEHFQWACVPDNAASREAYMWLTSFFSLVGDSAPNRNCKIQLPGIYTYESIHKIYKHHIQTLYSGNEHEPLEIRAFRKLWKNIFPNVTITKFCQVSGKCFTCHALYERQEVFTCENDLKDIKKLATIHKILIEMQRGSYMRNRELAQEYPELYFSLIIDGMSQDHCIIPYYAGQAQETGVEIKQKIIGAKQHGISRTFYRFFPHIKTGGNVACEVLLQEIERRMDWCIANNVPFARVCLIQMDGGPENTSKTFYALCEYLVRQRVFDRIEAARLPVGHTHEDIDAMFGVLWRAAQGKTIISPQQWKQMALSAFNEQD